MTTMTTHHCTWRALEGGPRVGRGLPALAHDGAEGLRARLRDRKRAAVECHRVGHGHGVDALVRHLSTYHTACHGTQYRADLPRDQLPGDHAEAPYVTALRQQVAADDLGRLAAVPVRRGMCTRVAANHPLERAGYFSQVRGLCEAPRQTKVCDFQHIALELDAAVALDLPTGFSLDTHKWGCLVPVPAARWRT